METFTTRKRAESVFGFLVQEKCPLLTAKGVAKSIKDSIYGDNEESFHIIEEETNSTFNNTKIMYSVVKIENSYIEYIETFPTKSKADKIFVYMVQENFPFLEASDMKDILKEGVWGTDDESYHLIAHKIS
jgi:hypothetical protein